MQKHLLLLITAFATQLAAGDWNAFDITMKGKEGTAILKKVWRSRILCKTFLDCFYFLADSP